MDRSNSTKADDSLSSLFEVATGLIDMVQQAARRGGTDIPSLKAQCFDLIVEALAASATRLSGDPSGPLHDRAQLLAARIAAFQGATVDVRLKLIELTEDWKCPVCGKDVARGIAVTRKSPLEVEVVCRNCQSRSPLPGRGERRLHELFDAVASPSWDPATNGFVS